MVRERAEADIAACARLARLVHERDGYPHYPPGDLRSFIASPGAYRAWVAEQGGAVIGHVALHRGTTRPVLETASAALGRPPHRLGVVARLLVSPHTRRAGAGRALLETAAREAAARGLSPILDVATDLAAAISLYERCGWVRAGAVTVRFSDGNTLREYVYLAPAERAGWFAP
jgi:GNAT superfamily N-acetyltransferase